MRERLLKYAPWIGYPLLFIVCLLVFAAITFPYDKLKDRVVASFNAQQRETNGKQELQIDEMHGYWLSGVKVSGARLTTVSTDPDKPPARLVIDEATVRYGIWSSLVGNTDMTFDVYAFGGEASGTYEVKGKGDKIVDVTLDGVDLSEMDPVTQLLDGTPIHGKLSGTVRLTMPEGKASKGSGSVSLDIKDVAVGDAKKKVMGLPPLSVGLLSIAADAKDGVLKLTKLSAGGKDLELQGDGRIVMRELATDSLCEAQIRVKISDAYKNKDDMTKSVFVGNGPLPPLVDATPAVSRAKRPDGFFVWNVRGPLGHPDFQPAGGAGLGASMPAAMPSMPGGFASPKVTP